ncbi:thiamine pyrophosphate-dependent enzyme [Dethiobacter alkaliphilus]|uniref:thiamine pyrophosphate-dependent enzyme n=1 Tax=Dethiobacter alkaliphilus TaxID=427926 RepID=UPI002226A146|nr:thiamine pyrophosphate-dependent enzyme [Dethiobacter alkaliphilus]MCW3489835.1 thiamine pyrophosphate-dependent enzyme [Dethiobacter alkaliphilus]
MTKINQVPREEYLFSGHTACPGCSAALSVRHLTKVLGKDTVFVITACCFSIIAGPIPLRSFDLNVYHCPFPSAAATGSGLKRGLQAMGDDKTQVVVLAGDGGTFDIGLQGLSGAAERNEDIIYICYDNEAYMNTGMQRSSASPYGSGSNTTPSPKVKENPKKDIMKIIEAHRIPYAATATVSHPADLLAKFNKAKTIKGFRFFHLLCPCPPGWGIESDETIVFSRLAVETGVFPLYEMIKGEQINLTYEPESLRPLKDYIDGQRRFAALSDEEIAVMQKEVDKNWQALLEKNKT